MPSPFAPPPTAEPPPPAEPPSPALATLQRDLRAFVAERDWDRFHSPRNLAASVAIEAGELLECFQWADPDAREVDAATRRRAEEETADVLLYALLLADKLGFDPIAAAREKLVANAAKYPIEKARGSSAKYTEL